MVISWKKSYKNRPTLFSTVDHELVGELTGDWWLQHIFSDPFAVDKSVGWCRLVLNDLEQTTHWIDEISAGIGRLWHAPNLIILLVSLSAFFQKETIRIDPSRIRHIHIMSGWWLSPSPLKNMSSLSSSVGVMTFPIYGKNKKCSKPPTRCYTYNFCSWSWTLEQSPPYIRLPHVTTEPSDNMAANACCVRWICCTVLSWSWTEELSPP